MEFYQTLFRYVLNVLSTNINIVGYNISILNVLVYVLAGGLFLWFFIKLFE